VKRFVIRVLGALPQRPMRKLYRLWLVAVAAEPDTRVAMRELLEIQAELDDRLDEAAIRYDDGVHVKHRLMRYHDFFVDRVRDGERVVDIGCGKAELASDLVERSGANVVGVDINREYLDFARARFQSPRLELVELDALHELPPGPFDVVVLSNVLEHIEHREELLRRIVRDARPSRILIRVPTRDRHWTVPLRGELGLFPFSDRTHFVEYTREEFVDELGRSGLAVVELQAVWGELWADARPL
jgi:2-polyprenyl-3-methyl-5-hydroxy-6-metoxy-1,4-benzoquinol methylase